MSTLCSSSAGIASVHLQFVVRNPAEMTPKNGRKVLKISTPVRADLVEGGAGVRHDHHVKPQVVTHTHGG